MGLLAATQPPSVGFSGWGILFLAAPGVLAIFGILAAMWRFAHRAVPAVDALLTLNQTTSRMDERAATMEQRQQDASRRQDEMLDLLRSQADALGALAVQLQTLHDYSHEGFHAIGNNLTLLSGTNVTSQILIERLEQIAQDLRHLPGRIKEP